MSRRSERSKPRRKVWESVTSAPPAAPPKEPVPPKQPAPPAGDKGAEKPEKTKVSLREETDASRSLVSPLVSVLPKAVPLIR